MDWPDFGILARAMNSLSLESSLRSIKGIGPQLSKLLEKKGLSSLEDALYFLPRTYEDRTRITPIAKIALNSQATVLASVLKVRPIYLGRGASRLTVSVKDETGQMDLVWFRATPYLQKDFSVGDRFLLYGQVQHYRGMLQMVHPEYEKVVAGEGEKPKTSANFGRIVPIYSETEGLFQKTIRRLMGEVLKASLPLVEESLPDSLRERHHLPKLRESFQGVHFPANLNDATQSAWVKRIIFEEFFVLHLGLLLNKRRQQTCRTKAFVDTGILQKFKEQLPFSFTEDQSEALKAIASDLASPRPMARLLQGDVGSGKTVVALAAASVVLSAGSQVALMVPTEVLAQQHFLTAKRWVEPLGFSVGLVTQSSREGSESQLLIGTQALFQKKIKLPNLGFVIVDEQHRFGVEQRRALLEKSSKPVHLLMMTATPIPRTLSLTLFGDLDLTQIASKPLHRQPIQTRILLERDRPRLYQKIRSAIQQGQQVYVIYPLIEESEKLELKSATQMFEKLQKEIFPEFKLRLLHGRMKPSEKSEILAAFHRNEFPLLVSTTVIEVGIDVPNATLMIIEHPERLGLSQMHQLRGRVGRGKLSSECILVASGPVTERLRVMERTDNGFEIADEDLRIRGPGQFLGTQQHGLPGFRVGHIVRDASLLEIARQEAEGLLKEDPNLEASENLKIKKLVEGFWGNKIERLNRG